MMFKEYCIIVNNTYNEYLQDCKDFNTKPISYEDWLELQECAE